MLTSNMTSGEMIRELEAQGQISPEIEVLLKKIREEYLSPDQVDEAIDEATKEAGMKVMEFVEEEFGIGFSYD